MAIISYYKKYGETLKEMCNRFRKERPDSKLTYAGRLDPMAEGLILLLTEDDVKRKEEFTSLDKDYEVEFFFGVQTDTYDILGLFRNCSYDIQRKKEEEVIVSSLNEVSHIIDQAYPPYSSKTVKGKSLWQWSRYGKLNCFSIPSQRIQVSKALYQNVNEYSKEKFQTIIFDSVSKVQGDFRQEAILTHWKNYFKSIPTLSFFVYRCFFSVSSGTYIRSLIQSLASSLGHKEYATSIKIRRTRIGNYFLEEN